MAALGLIGLLSLWLWPTQGLAQTMNLANFNNNGGADKVVVVSPCDPLNITIQPPGGSAGLTWAFAPGFETLPPGASGMQSGDNFVITGPPPIAGINYAPGFTVDQGATQLTALMQIQIQVSTQPPITTLLVLDRSGSMGQAVAGAPGGETKWDITVDAASRFIEEFKNLAPQGSQVGLAFFDNEWGEYGGGAFYAVGAGNTLPEEMPLKAFLADPAQIAPRNLTCIGGSLYDAIQNLSSSGNAINSVILFSDGMQNTDPAIEISGSTVNVVENSATYSATGTGFSGGFGTYLLSNAGIPIHTITVSDLSTVSLNQAIATATGGQAIGFYTMVPTIDQDPYAGGEDAWELTFINQLNCGSPQMASLQRGVFDTNTTGTGTFGVNDSAEELLLRVSGLPERRVTSFQVLKENKVVYERTSQASYYLFAIERGELAQYGLSSLSGEWRYRIGYGRPAKEPVTYSAAAIVEDRYVKARVRLSQPSYEPGQSLAFEVAFTNGGVPIPNADQVRAIVLKPGQDFNDLLSQPADLGSDESLPLEGEANPGQNKYDQLVGGSQAFLDELGVAEQVIDLSFDAAAGVYRGSFAGSNTEASGIYRLYFFTRHQDSLMGLVERFDLKTVAIDFGTADAGNTDFQVQVVNGVNILSITPRNQFGHLLGPNRLGQVLVLINGQAQRLTDNLDGTYTATLAQPLAATDQVKVGIKGAGFFDGPAAKIKGVGGGGFLSDLLSNLPWWVILLLLLLAGVILYFVRRAQGGSTP
jgi:hypothetical protein